MANKSFETVREVKYFGKAVTNKNYIDEEIKRRLNSANVCILCWLFAAHTGNSTRIVADRRKTTAHKYDFEMLWSDLQK